MFAGRLAEAAAIAVLATIVTAVIAAPVLRAPSERVFGMEIVGRHHDPFTVMQQFERPIAIGVYTQPVTDIAGAFLARLSGAVAAYNWLVLLSFPLSAAAAYLLARHLTLSPAGATVAAMAYAFSPFHIAHAAYHPHIAQTQWVPLYLLALWRCLDKASPAAVGFLGAAAIAVALSNFYAGMIMAVITPVALAAYWLFAVRLRPAAAGLTVRLTPSAKATGVKKPDATDVTRKPDATSGIGQPMRELGITVASLLLIAASGMAYASYTAADVVANRAAFAFARADLFRYSAKWWSYLVPPVEHPLFGAVAQRIWYAAGVREGLLEQQVSLGWGIIALGLVASFAWLAEVRSAKRRERRLPDLPCLPRVPVLVIVAVAALFCSLSPERTIGAFTFVRPSALLYTVVPMFRSYARFGVVVQLMAALLAGIGVDSLRRAGSKSVHAVCLVLLALTAAEYAVAPSALWRDVLPTMAHRWIVRQPGRVQALDCTPLNQESESVQWLTAYRVRLLPGPGQRGSIEGCTDANLSRTLAAHGYSHVLVRTVHGGYGPPFADSQLPEGLRLAARFDDGLVFAVMEQTTATGPGEQP